MRQRTLKKPWKPSAVGSYIINNPNTKRKILSENNWKGGNEAAVSECFDDLGIYLQWFAHLRLFRRLAGMLECTENTHATDKVNSKQGISWGGGQFSSSCWITQMQILPYKPTKDQCCWSSKRGSRPSYEQSDPWRWKICPSLKLPLQNRRKRWNSIPITLLAWAEFLLCMPSHVPNSFSTKEKRKSLIISPIAEKLRNDHLPSRRGRQPRAPLKTDNGWRPVAQSIRSRRHT